jgi:hypothetical protein
METTRLAVTGRDSRCIHVEKVLALPISVGTLTPGTEKAGCIATGLPICRMCVRRTACVVARTGLRDIAWPDAWATHGASIRKLAVGTTKSDCIIADRSLGKLEGRSITAGVLSTIFTTSTFFSFLDDSVATLCSRDSWRITATDEAVSLNPAIAERRRNCRDGAWREVSSIGGRSRIHDIPTRCITC